MNAGSDDPARAVLDFLDAGEQLLVLDCVGLIDGRGIPGGTANRRRRSRVIGDLLSLLPSDIPRFVSGRVAGGAPDSICARVAAALRTDEYDDVRTEHYLAVTGLRVLVARRIVPNSSLAVRPLPWSPLAVGAELGRTEVTAAARTSRGLNTARLRLDFADRSWLMPSPSLGDRSGKVDRMVAALRR